MKPLTFEEWLELNPDTANVEERFEVCPECGGDGYYECEECGSIVDCDICGGNGETDIVKGKYEIQLRKDKFKIESCTVNGIVKA